MEQGCGDRAPLTEGLFDGLEEGRQQAWDGDERGNPSFSQRAPQVRAGQRMREDDREALSQRRQQSDHEGIDVVQWQRQQQPFVGPVDPFVH